MIQFEKSCSEIRGLISQSCITGKLIETGIIWKKICSSLDVIEDSQLAIQFYLQLPEFSAHNGGYIFIYGVLQAAFIQQDAVDNLYLALFKHKIDIKNKYPNLQRIRDLRNSAIGHPTSRGKDDSFHGISRVTISKKGFTLASFYPKKPDTSFTDILIPENLDKQKKDIMKILRLIVKKIKMNISEQREKFKNDLLQNLIPKSFEYHLTKLYDALYHEPTIYKVNLDIIRKTYEDLKKGILDRYESLIALPNIKDSFKMLEYLLQQLYSKFENNSFINDPLDTRIYIDSLKKEFKELKKTIIEIDREFQS